MTRIMTNKTSNHSENIHWKILVALTDQLKIPDGKYEDAIKKYEAVGEWLNNSEDSVLSNAFIYTQGSVKLGTTVKPYKYDEHDIDLVVHLPSIDESYSSESVKNIVGERLKINKIYEGKISPLKRGWRINYAGDFHLDITPAIPDNSCDNSCPINKQFAEHVPDSELLHWKASNPRGYAKWFHDIDEKMPMFALDGISVMGLESRNVEKVPDQHEFKGVLKRSIQLLKRHRDIFFNEKHIAHKGYMPISILITTLAAQAYEDIIKTGSIFSPIELIKLIIKSMKNYIIKTENRYYVGNPTNLKENFAEKWEKSSLYEKSFIMWSEAAYEDLEDILNMSGLDNVGKSINSSFGGSYGEKVLESLTKDVSKSRGLGLMPGIFTLGEGVTEAKVAKNTFYGK